MLYWVVTSGKGMVFVELIMLLACVVLFFVLLYSIILLAVKNGILDAADILRADQVQRDKARREDGEAATPSQASDQGGFPLEELLNTENTLLHKKKK